MEDRFLKRKKKEMLGSIICKHYTLNHILKFLTDLEKTIIMTPINSISATKIVEAPLNVLLSTACLLELQRPTCREAACDYLVNDSKRHRLLL
jgi:hypothetical protein